MIYYQSINQRKCLTKTSLPRIYYIGRKIAEESYTNAPKLAREYEKSLSTINRDIVYMRDMLNAPIAYDEDRNDMRIFTLPGITGLALMNTKFSIPANFDYCGLEGLNYFAIFPALRHTVLR